jgi:hypothetical protein
LESVKAEAALERRLWHGGELVTHCKLANLGTQFPVGLFRDKVALGNRIFPGGAGAIDMIGVDAIGTTLWLFELKAGSNIPAGVISEILLYGWMLQDAISRNFKFEKEQSADPAGVQPGDVVKCQRIEARFIGHQFHPLLDDGRILSILNGAMCNDDVPVRFGTIHVVDKGNDSQIEFFEKVPLPHRIAKDVVAGN